MIYRLRFCLALLMSVAAGMWPAASLAAEIKTSPLVETFKKTIPTFVSIRDADEATEGKPPSPLCGVIVDSRGFVLTTSAVSHFGENVSVELHDQTKHPAKVTAVDEKLGIALLKVETKNSLQAIAIADSDAVELGDSVLIVSGAHGLVEVVDFGLVSRTDLPVHGIKMLCIDTSSGPGTGPGPVIDSTGKMIGFVAKRCNACPTVPSNLLREFITR